MTEFLQSIPSAAMSPYAFVAYAIAAILFLFAGKQLRMANLLMTRIESIPENERRRVVEIATDTMLPAHITPEHWIRIKRLRYIFTLIGSLVIAALSVTAIALLNPTKSEIENVEKAIADNAKQTQNVVKKKMEQTEKLLVSSTEKIVTSVEDSALATLETMFPLAVRSGGVDVDSTIVHLDGSQRQLIVSYDNDLSPMELRWGDLFHYFIYSENNVAIDSATELQLEVVRSTGVTRLPLKIDPYTEQQLRIPGSNPAPMRAYLVNKSGARQIAIKITIYSSDRERGRERFREALMNTTLNSAARRAYFEVNGEGVRLRSGPSTDFQVLRTTLRGTYVKIKVRNNNGWCQVRLPEGREGWMKCSFLVPIAS